MLMEYDYTHMVTLQCPHCSFKNVWGKSLDHHIFFSKDNKHKESRDILKAIGWVLSMKYDNPNQSKLVELASQ